MAAPMLVGREDTVGSLPWSSGRPEMTRSDVKSEREGADGPSPEQRRPLRVREWFRDARAGFRLERPRSRL
jgi:hypothetical protein